jgi:hypothetical protein
VLAVVATWRGVRADARPAVRVVALPTVLASALFVASALRGRVEANWPAPAWLGALALACIMARHVTWRRQWRAGVGIAATMTVLVLAYAVARDVPSVAAALRARGLRDPLDQTRGWEALADSARTLDRSASARSWLAASKYQDAATLEWTMAAHPLVLAIAIGGRPTAQDYWPDFAHRARPGDRLVLALAPGGGDGGDDMPAMVRALAPCFTRTRVGALVPMRLGARLLRTRRLYLLEGWRGGWPAARTPAGGVTDADSRAGAGGCDAS